MYKISIKKLMSLFGLIIAVFIATRVLVAVLTRPELVWFWKSKSLRDVYSSANVNYPASHYTYQAAYNNSTPPTIVVLGYQRSGSTFFGQLFNNDPEAFYLFEPVDAVYTNLYGTIEGWNVPTDLIAYPNGTERRLPDVEVRAVAETLAQLLTCDTDLLPTESLLHKYYHQFAVDQKNLFRHHQCLASNKLQRAICVKKSGIDKLCGMRFGQVKVSLRDQCFQGLSNPTNQTDERLQNYNTCITDMRIKLNSTCLSYFRETCLTKQRRAVKTVRATMASMELLLEGVPGFHVLHLVRDPRAVVLSRKNYDSSAQSRYGNGDLVRESTIYCRSVVNNIRTGQRLDKRFPGRIRTVIYDDFAMDPMKHALEVYDFLGYRPSTNTLTLLNERMFSKSNSTSIAEKWQAKISVKTMKAINEECKELFDELPDVWIR